MIIITREVLKQSHQIIITRTFGKTLLLPTLQLVAYIYFCYVEHRKIVMISRDFLQN